MKNIEINSKQELYDYLNNFDFKAFRNTEMSSVYFLIEYDNKLVPVYFTSYEDAWFESPCQLRRCSMEDDRVAEYVREVYAKEFFDKAYEYEKMFQIDGYHYEIENYQCFGFIPEKCKIVKPMTEIECLKWLIDNYIDSEKEN